MLRILFVLIFLLQHGDCFPQDLSSKENISAKSVTEDDGRSDYVPRVVNGRIAKLGEAPYQLSLKMKYRQMYMSFCGGTLIAPSKVVSAAHCFVDRSGFFARCSGNVKVPNSRLRRTHIVAGNLQNLAKFQDGGQWRKLKSMKVPGRYRFPALDIAVGTNVASATMATGGLAAWPHSKLPRSFQYIGDWSSFRSLFLNIRFTTEPFVLNDHVKTIPFATEHKDYERACRVSGYGRISRSQVSDVLLLADLELIRTKRCSKIHYRNMKKFVCTSQKVSDVGKGDSGGPLICAKTNDPADLGQGILVGVVSGYRENCGTFFTRVSSYKNFLTKGNAIRTCSNNVVILMCLLNGGISVLLFCFIYLY